MHARLQVIILSLFFLPNLRIFAEIPEVLNDRTILLGNNSLPSIEFICLSHDINSVGLEYIDLLEDPMENIIQTTWDLNISSNGKPMTAVLSKIQSYKFNDWLLRQPLLSNELLWNEKQNDIPSYKSSKNSEKYNFYKTTFLLECPSDQIESFDYGSGFLIGIGREMIDFSIDQQLKVIEEFALSEKLLVERNQTRDVKFNDAHKELKRTGNQQKEGGFAKFALYLLISGGALVIYSFLAPISNQEKKSTQEKAEEARRKRWLKKIHNLGWIDRERYLFLLKRLESLPEWLGGINPPDQSAETGEGMETSVDLSKRKSGESVVKTKDTSEDNTSR